LFFLSKHENNAIIGLYLKLEQTSAPSSECICQISKIQTYSGSRSSKVIDLGVNRALKSREISRKNTGILAHMWHQPSLLGVNQSRPVTLKDHVWSKAIKVAWPDFWIT